MSSPLDQTKEDQELVAFARNKLEERRSSSSRAANEAIWLTNIAYFCGLDSVEFDSKSKQFRAASSLPRSVNRSRVHVNKILPTCQNRLAKLCKSNPKWDVRPKSSDDEDKEAARLGKSVIMQDWESCRVVQKRSELVMWTQFCGHAYLKTSWDPALGPKNLLKNGDEVELVTEGDKRVDVRSPFTIFPDPMAKSWDEVNDLIEVNLRPLKYFKDQYPERGGLVKEEDCWLSSLTYEMRVNSFNSQGGGQANSAPLKNHAIEISYYEKASKAHPGGRHIIVANGVLLKDDILPIDEIPFSKFDDIKVAGKYNSEAVVTHLRPMQDQYNRNKTLKAAWLNRTLMGKYIAARGHGLAAESFNDQSGEIIEYDAIPSGDQPKALDVPMMPSYVFQEDESLIADINDVSGISQTSRGQVESASMPALGMQMLIEQDDTRIGVVLEGHEYSYADVGRHLLKFTGKYYTSDRLLKEAGSNFAYVVKRFKGDDLRDNFDVHVIRGSTIPGSKTLNRQDIKTLHQEGYFGNPQDPKVVSMVLSMLEFGDEFEPWRRQSLIDASIDKGIQQIKEQGTKPPVSEFDNHPTWIQKLDDFRLSDAFPKLSEEQQSLVIQVMEEHLQLLQEIVAPESMEDPSKAPDLKQTTAAQEQEQELLAQGPQDAESLAQTAPLPITEEPPPQGEI